MSELVFFFFYYIHFEIFHDISFDLRSSVSFHRKLVIRVNIRCKLINNASFRCNIATPASFRRGRFRRGRRYVLTNVGTETHGLCTVFKYVGQDKLKRKT